MELSINTHETYSILYLRAIKYELIINTRIKMNTAKPRFTNASDHEQLGLRTNFPNTKRLGWLLCLELRTRKPSTSWSDKLWVSASAVFVEWSSGKYPESATPIGESVSCCVAFVHSNSLCLLLNFSVFCVFYKLLNRTPWGQRKTMIAAKWKEKIPIPW